MTTIEIIREQADKQNAVYRAICGEQQAAGVTPGEALDALEQLLATRGAGHDAGTVIIVQRFRPDAFFTEQQQARLRELMDRFHAARDSGQELPPEQKQELEALVHAEWQAAIQRAEAMLDKFRCLTRNWKAWGLGTTGRFVSSLAVMKVDTGLVSRSPSPDGGLRNADCGLIPSHTRSADPLSDATSCCFLRRKL
jgi:hypothetical protein